MLVLVAVGGPVSKCWLSYTLYQAEVEEEEGAHLGLVDGWLELLWRESWPDFHRHIDPVLRLLVCDV